jgi:carbonic anhydrase
MLSADEALKRLREGNHRFVSESSSRHDDLGTRRAELAAGQDPFAIVLGCSDSRVPAEIIFDQGLGDLFVIRVAGNIVAPSLVGSAEFAASRFGSRLVIVVGHTQCGAILETVKELQEPSRTISPNLQAITDRVRPAVEPLMNRYHDADELVRHAVRANVVRSVAQLRADSALLRNLIENDGLRIVGAEYVLETGVVEFLDAT